jgi:hypothetical protein
MQIQLAADHPREVFQYGDDSRRTDLRATLDEGSFNDKQALLGCGIVP